MIFVTGGTGLVGSHLLFELVKSGKKVRALKRPGSDLSHINKVFSYYSEKPGELFSLIEWVEGDILDIYSLTEALENVDYVYHSAAIVSYHPRDYSSIQKINREGTSNLVNASLEKKIKKFCHVSSVSAIGKSEKEITEETPWKTSRKNSVYAISKYGAEREVWRGAEEGLDVVVVNPSVIIGPGHWKYGSPSVFGKAEKGIWYYTKGGAGFVDVRDVVRVMMQLMQSEIRNERFIVSSENLSYVDFLSLVNESLHKKKPFFGAGPILLNVAMALEWFSSRFNGKRPSITREIASALQTVNAYSNKKIRDILQMEFIPMEKSIRETAELFRKDFKN